LVSGVVGLPGVVPAVEGLAVLHVGLAAVLVFSDVVGLEEGGGAVTAVGVTAAAVLGSQGGGLGGGEEPAGVAEAEDLAMGVEEDPPHRAGEQGQDDGVDGDDGAVVELVQAVAG
jgi:hypothetical protein